VTGRVSWFGSNFGGATTFSITTLSITIKKRNTQYKDRELLCWMS